MRLIDRATGGERALLVHVFFNQARASYDLHEFKELAESAGVKVCNTATARRDAPDPKLFVGSGKADEIADLCKDHDIEVVLFNHDLAPTQERNLERLLECRVVNRTGLILDIFAQRARSFEGKLQVELAQLSHLSTRLIRGWTHLERQKGGIGLRGPGETQLETDRRLIGQRIKQINVRLKRVLQRRRQSAKSRRRALLSTVSLIGYTNAGKSTLFNRVAGSDIYTADQLFATLDTTLRTVNVPGEHPVVLSDTVGFIRGLPPELVAAFQATLEETRDASLLLHIIDASDEDRDARISDVVEVLERIGVADVPVLEVYNKIDRITGSGPGVERDADGNVSRIWLSALDGAGCHLLIDAIAEHVNRKKHRRWLLIDAPAGRFRAMLYEIGAVTDELDLEHGGWLLETTVSEARWQPYSRMPEVIDHVREIDATGKLTEFDPVVIERQSI